MSTSDEERESSPSMLLGGISISANRLVVDEKESHEKKSEIHYSKIVEISNQSKVTEPSKKDLKKHIEDLIEKYQTEKLIRTLDKVTFVFSLSRILFEAFMLGRFPCYFPHYYTIVLIILVIIRFFYYRFMRWHYFLLDFCYWANLSLLIYLWIYPNNEFFFISTYAFSLGPLLIAVPIFRNSMVLHSIEKLTSVYIHIVPGLVMWSIRYNYCSCWPSAKITPTVFKYLSNAFVLYFLWAVIYYIIIFKLTLERCNKKNNTTMFGYMIENKNSVFYKMTGILGEKFRGLLFMSVHMVFCLFTLLLTYMCLHSEALHLIFMISAILATFWAAATYYMEIFSKNYELKLQNLQKIKQNLNASINKSD